LPQLMVRLCPIRNFVADGADVGGARRHESISAMIELSRSLTDLPPELSLPGLVGE
jgi:hypothetical protein